MSTADVMGEIDRYLERLRDVLCGLSPAERDEVVEEIRTHILERVEAEQPLSVQGVKEILRAVGDPRELAEEYKTQAMLRQAVGSRSPLLLLRATLRWAVRGVAGVVAFLVTGIGYGWAALFSVCALLKPFFPSRIGLFLGPERTLSFGYWNGHLAGAEVYGISVRPPADFALLGTLGSTNGPIRELLGYWLIPTALVCGTLCFLTTTFFVRWLIRKFGRRKHGGSASYRHSIGRAEPCSGANPS